MTPIDTRLAIQGGAPAVAGGIPEWPQFDERELTALRRVLESRVWGGYNDAIQELEQRFAAFHGTAHAVALANGTVSLEIALIAAGIGTGDEVIVPPISFIASATSIARVGAVPVFADVSPDTINLDPAAAEAALTTRTRAIVLVHFAGCPADLDAFTALADRHGLVLIEDSAHAPGARWKEQPVASFGAFGSFSFQASKNLTAGEGGMLVARQDDLAERARSLANQGRRRGGAWYEHVNLGTNARMTGFQAALLLAQLDRLSAQIERRTRAADRLRRALDAVPGLRIHPPHLDRRVGTHAYHLFSMEIDEATFGASRTATIEALRAEGVPVSAGYPHPLYRNALFEAHAHRVTPCPVAERYCRTSIWLPHQVLLAEDAVIDGVAAAWQKVHRQAASLAAAK